MATQNGTAVNFGISGTTFTGTGLGSGFLQSVDRQNNADMDETKDEDGNAVNHTWFNYHGEASLEYIVKGSSISDASVQTKIPLPGAFVTITSSKDTDLAGTTWEVQASPKVNRSNTGKAKVTVSIKKYAGITSAAS